MATWRLTASHYLNIRVDQAAVDAGIDERVEWVYEEQDRVTGRKLRKRFPVPMYLNPAEPSYHHVNGELYVAQEGKLKPMKGALIFVGEPTPDMEPMDDEAEEISNGLKLKWVGPMSEAAFPGQGQSYGDKLLEGLTAQLSSLLANNPLPKAAPMIAQVQVDQLAEVQKQMAALLAQNEALTARLDALGADKDEPELPLASGKASSGKPVERRV